MALIRLERSAVRAGAVADLALMAPVVAAYGIVHATGVVSGDGAAIVTAVVGALIAPFVGGVVAGQHPTGTPLTHGAAAATVASLAFVVFRVADGAMRDRPVHPASVVFLVILGTTFGLLGGLMGSRRGREGLADSAP